MCGNTSHFYYLIPEARQKLLQTSKFLAFVHYANQSNHRNLALSCEWRGNRLSLRPPGTFRAAVSTGENARERNYQLHISPILHLWKFGLERERQTFVLALAYLKTWNLCSYNKKDTETHSLTHAYMLTKSKLMKFKTMNDQKILR